MPQYRRLDCPGATLFFTVVTAGRRPILTGPAIDLLRNAIRAVQHAHPFEINAAVILPDHLHMLWTLPPNDDDFPNRWSQIKSRFTREYLENGGAESTRSASRERRSERGVELIAPHRKNRKPQTVTQDRRPLQPYKRRWTVERTIAWIQHFRRLCIRWEKSTTLYQGFLHIGCTMLLLKEVLGRF